jgi:hypothetical protein
LTKETEITIKKEEEKILIYEYNKGTGGEKNIENC